MKFGTFLMSMVQPLLGKILVSLGFSVVTFVGFQAVVNQLQSRLVLSVNGLPSEMLQVFLLAGGGEGISMIVAAIAVRVLIWQAMNTKKILGANPG